MRYLILIMAMVILFGISSLASAGDERMGAQIDHAEKLLIEKQVRQEARWKALEQEAAHLFEHVDRNGAGSTVREVNFSR
ncbi:MAG: hypothetical protein ACP5U1_13805 [Desulfomonilaceae bacterium]